jgi:hypothetical protein
MKVLSIGRRSMENRPARIHNFTQPDVRQRFPAAACFDADAVRGDAEDTVL